MQKYYTCDRYVYRQGPETRCPGEFTRLYLHPKKEGTAYQKIEDVPEVSRTTMLRYFKDVPSIMLFEDSTENRFYPKKPVLKELLTPEVIRIAKGNYCDPYYRTSDDTFFGYLQSKAAVTLSMNGYDPVQLAESYGLKSYTELPLTLEDVWNRIIQAPNGDAGMAGDILLQMRLGRYARRLPPRDLEMMKRIGLPEWFPDYACKVRHLFPKAHCIDFAYTHLVEAWAECMM